MKKVVFILFTLLSLTAKGQKNGIKWNPDSTQVFAFDGKKKWKLVDSAACHTYKMEGLSLLYTGNNYALKAKEHKERLDFAHGDAFQSIADSLYMESMFYGMVFTTCRSKVMTQEDKEAREGFKEVYWLCKRNFESYKQKLQKPKVQL